MAQLTPGEAGEAGGLEGGEVGVGLGDRVNQAARAGVALDVVGGDPGAF